MNRPVQLLGYSLFHPDVPGRIAGFDPVRYGILKKNLKTMTRAVQLGVAGIAAALEGVPGWKDFPPERRGLYVGASPQSGDPADLLPALEAVGRPFSLQRFAEVGVPLIPPLWLVKGLSNNILGYAAAAHDCQGDNGNWCDGRLGGAVALCNAARAIAEGRVDLAIAGAADSFVGAEALLDIPGSEGAAFVVLSAGEGQGPRVTSGAPVEEGVDLSLGELGAAAIPVALLRRWQAVLSQAGGGQSGGGRAEAGGFVIGG